MEKIKIKIDQSNCLGCGACVSAAPEALEISTEGKAKVKDEWAEREIDSPELIKKLENAQQMCPLQLITLESAQ